MAVSSSFEQPRERLRAHPSRLLQWGARHLFAPRPFDSPALEAEFLQTFRAGSLEAIRTLVLALALLACAMAFILSLHDDKGLAHDLRWWSNVLVAVVFGLLGHALRRWREALLARYTWAVGVPFLLAALSVASAIAAHVATEPMHRVQGPVAIVFVSLAVAAFARLPVREVMIISGFGNLSVAGALASAPEPPWAVIVYLLLTVVAAMAIATSVERRERGVFMQLRMTAAASRAKSHVLAAVSHDLRQPLAALTLHLDLMQSNVAAGRKLELAHHAGRMEACLREMDGNLSRLLELGRLQGTSEALAVERVDLCPLLDRLEALHALQAATAGVRLDIERPAPALRWVMSDERRLATVLANLVHNAIKFSHQARPGGGGRVSVRVLRQGGSFSVRVEDNGPGIAPEFHERIFDEYGQLGNPGRDPHAGYGLGLAIVRQTVTRLPGHRIDLFSSPGEGACFALGLPPADSPAAPPPCTTERSRDDRRAAMQSLAGRLALVVEDDGRVRDALAATLAGWDMDVLVAGSAAQAQAMADDSDRHIDVLLTDWRLAGGRTGDEVIARVRDACMIPLSAVVFTGEPIDAAFTARLPADTDILQKPLEAASLARALQAATRRTLRARALARDLQDS